MMAAIAEGLSILKHANVGTTAVEADAETTPLRDPSTTPSTSISPKSPKCGDTAR